VTLPVGAPTLNVLVMTVTYALMMNALKMKTNVYLPQLTVRMKMPVPLHSVITIPEAVFTPRFLAMIITHVPLILVIVILVVNIMSAIATLQMLVLSALVTA